MNDDLLTILGKSFRWGNKDCLSQHLFCGENRQLSKEILGHKYNR